MARRRTEELMKREADTARKRAEELMNGWRRGRWRAPLGILTPKISVC